MSIKKKISDTVYEVYVGYPDTVTVPVYRGDTFNFTLIGFNEEDDSPFDFSLYDSFSAQIRFVDPRNTNIEKTITNASFTLGKTDVSLMESDELHLSSTEASDLNKPYNIYWMDIQGILGTEKRTFIKLKLIVELDLTKENA